MLQIIRVHYPFGKKGFLGSMVSENIDDAIYNVIDLGQNQIDLIICREQFFRVTQIYPLVKFKALSEDDPLVKSQVSGGRKKTMNAISHVMDVYTKESSYLLTIKPYIDPKKVELTFQCIHEYLSKLEEAYEAWTKALNA